MTTSRSVFVKAPIASIVTSFPLVLWCFGVYPLAASTSGGTVALVDRGWLETDPMTALLPWAIPGQRRTIGMTTALKLLRRAHRRRCGACGGRGRGWRCRSGRGGGSVRTRDRRRGSAPSGGASGPASAAARLSAARDPLQSGYSRTAPRCAAPQGSAQTRCTGRSSPVKDGYRLIDPPR